jgi:hypothetical protein
LAEQVATDQAKAEVVRTDRPQEGAVQSPSLDLLVQRAASAYRQGRSPSAAFTPATLLALQRTAGNRAVNALLSRHAGNPAPQVGGIGQRTPTAPNPGQDTTAAADPNGVAVDMSAVGRIAAPTVGSGIGGSQGRPATASTIVRSRSVQLFKTDPPGHAETEIEDDAKSEPTEAEGGQSAPPADPGSGTPPPPDGAGGNFAAGAAS